MAVTKEVDMVNHPPHYTDGKIEVIEFIEDKKLGYHLGQVVKYVSRAGKKENRLEDLKKAQWYLNREIELVEKVGPIKREDIISDEDMSDLKMELLVEAITNRDKAISYLFDLCDCCDCCEETKQNVQDIINGKEINWLV